MPKVKHSLKSAEVVNQLSEELYPLTKQWGRVSLTDYGDNFVNRKNEMQNNGSLWLLGAKAANYNGIYAACDFRQKVVNFMRNNILTLSEVNLSNYRDILSGYGGSNFEDHLQDLVNGNIVGGVLEVIAVSLILHRQIHLLFSNSETHAIICEHLPTTH